MGSDLGVSAMVAVLVVLVVNNFELVLCTKWSVGVCVMWVCDIYTQFIRGVWYNVVG